MNLAAAVSLTVSVFFILCIFICKYATLNIEDKRTHERMMFDKEDKRRG